jgi:hypothetical protein
MVLDRPLSFEESEINFSGAMMPRPRTAVEGGPMPSTKSQGVPMPGRIPGRWPY